MPNLWHAICSMLYLALSLPSCLHYLVFASLLVRVCLCCKQFLLIALHLATQPKRQDVWQLVADLPCASC